MSKIAILTDSASDIPPEYAEKYGIDILCFSLALDGKSYVERQDFGFDAFYSMLRSAQGVPSTSHITAPQFCEQFCRYVDEGYTDVLYVSINSTGSATYDAAVMAQGLLREERPEHHLCLHLVDSHTYSMTYGWYVCEAARKLRNGALLPLVIAELNEAFARSEVVLAAFSLKQMKKSGRVSAAAAFAGELLGLRPIVHLVDGESKVVAKVRGDSAVVPAMVKYALTRVEVPADADYQIGYTDIDNVTELIRACKKAFGHPPLSVFKLGAAVSSNTGPDAIAITLLGQARR